MSGMMLAASSKVKYLSDTGTFLRLKGSAKSFKSTPVSNPSKIKVLEFDSLMREDSKILFTRGEPLVLSCWLISFYNVSLWYVGVCSGLYLVSSCFVTMVWLLLLLYTERGTKTYCCISRQMINDESGKWFFEK